MGQYELRLQAKSRQAEDNPGFIAALVNILETDQDDNIKQASLFMQLTYDGHDTYYLSQLSST